MNIELNETHNPSLKSWVLSANMKDCDFPIQNLPFGVFKDTIGHHVGIAIGDQILDISKAHQLGLFTDESLKAAEHCLKGSLEPLMSLESKYWSAIRLTVSSLLREGCALRNKVETCLVEAKNVEMLLPCRIGDFTDFFTSIHHATNAGKLMRPDSPLMPNFKHLPVAYHSRSSSIFASGTKVLRPHGQFKAKDQELPSFGPSRRLDFELELGFFIGKGNSIGSPIQLSEAEDHVFGMCLLNDWSARDIQAWEYQPLGPFLGKSFLTTISPWIITLEALRPFRISSLKRSSQDPALLPYLIDLNDQKFGGLDIQLEVSIQSQNMKEKNIAPQSITKSSFADQYWSIFQMVTHHTVNGCNLNTGDLIGSGTVSGPNEGESGCFLEMTQGGSKPITLKDGSERRFLEDGDEIMFAAKCKHATHTTIGFGECRGIIYPNN